MKRVFLAIPMGDDPDVRKYYDVIRSSLQEEKIKWVKPENLHLTLHFFGDMEEEEIERAHRLFREYLSGLAAFDLVLRGVGVFPGIRKPRVLWFGVGAAEGLEALSGAVEEMLLAGDFDLPGKPFSPHLTIGRIRWIGERRGFEQLLSEKRDAEIVRQQVNEVHLIESVLHPEGPEYRSMYRYTLLEQ